MSNPRVTIAAILHEVVYRQHNLDTAFAQHLRSDDAQASFIKAACFGVLRHYHRLQFYLQQLMDKPLKQKDGDLHCLLLTGLYELFYMQTPDHAVVSESVNAAIELQKQWAKGLVNAVLRNALRRRAGLVSAAEQDPVACYAHPRWLLEKLKQDWPEHWRHIATQNNQPAPMTLRLETRQVSSDDYLSQLAAAGSQADAHPQVPCALMLREAVDVQALPGFAAGLVSVQDAAAQLAALLLDPQPGERILDACAAPGGKTLHLLQQQPALRELIALDQDPERLARIQENLQRAGRQATLRTGDAAQPADWWDHEPFDRILLDAPCSATGVIRRHPDIKLLRRADDISRLAQTQAQILAALWPLLKTGGMLLYSTCSVLKQENDQQIQEFIKSHPEAAVRPLAAAWGHAQACGRQILPGEDGMDGFYYALIYKQA